jgi:trans-aconitate 2-methyltransferase
MSDWNPEQYLMFQKERNQPIYDLISHIEIKNPNRILDIGCGPGNSTAVLKEYWKEAEVIGIDFSEAMINKARKDYPHINFNVGDAGKDLSYLGYFDIVFANASLQWIPDHKTLVPKLFQLVCTKGVFAFQIPQFEQMPIAKTIKSTAYSSKWMSYFTNLRVGYNFYPDESYYDYLNEKSSNIVLWATKYYHLMGNHTNIIEMIQSTGLKPYLDMLPTELYSDFLNDVLEGIKVDYPVQSDNRVLFPFDRLFAIAYHE